MALIHQQVFPPSETWDEAALTVQLGLPGSFGLICPSGFLLGRALAEQAEILTLAVLPCARRRGIGRALVAGAVREARARGATALFLEVAEANLAARALYDSFRATQVGRRVGYYPDGGDALVLRIGEPQR
jgi:ribosomal-protein-alanine N-acetyltransferase